ncbi:DUF6396 domain-containing protein [Pseudomonas sp. HR96]|uniref:SEL1-like repeat protein n=1 Tax=Pseudomonas sp. HR96 TaxID=1027966 RepID=UPI002A75D9AF|nr:DUF6396 domain-containing protein [Pseudomonas sp. HR96]WPP01098.1 DUF6396 domain-containing protein [Pseudomonas sp. HR96]
MKISILLILLFFAGCYAENEKNNSHKALMMHSQSDTKSKLSFACSHEKFPIPNDYSDLLFKYARWLQINNQLVRDSKVNAEIERLYRIAAEHGHYKANINLQNGTRLGMFKLNGKEHLRLSQDLIEAGVATGYYLIGTFLQRGYAGLAEDPEMALKYLRMAADRGNAEAQEYVGKKLVRSPVAWDIGWKMRQCAAEQGVGKAALALGMYYKTVKKYNEAAKNLQLGIGAGDETSAGIMRDVFSGPIPADVLSYLGQRKDLDRADRYNQIWSILADYSYANPKVPEINEIVPLPPAPLPEWDGKLQWLEGRLANIPPEKPTEELIKRLADEKKLEPATGKPMPGAAGFDQSRFPVKSCFSGQVCPQTGYWKAMWLPHEVRGMLHSEVIRHVKEGEIMPTHLAERYFVRSWPFSDKHTVTEERVHWGLLG